MRITACPLVLPLQAVDMFLSIIGAEAGAMALRCLAKGGVFIAGGIVPRLLDRVKKTGALRDAFINRTARERFQYLLRSMPLFVVTNTRVGIIGSRCGGNAGAWQEPCARNACHLLHVGGRCARDLLGSAL
jgi:glucokinase